MAPWHESKALFLRSSSIRLEPQFYTRIKIITGGRIVDATGLHPTTVWSYNVTLKKRNPTNVCTVHYEGGAVQGVNVNRAEAYNCGYYYCGL